MLDNLQLTYTPNDEEDEASAYEIFIDNATNVYVGNVLVDYGANRYDAEAVANLFVESPKLLTTVRQFVDWALRQPPRPRPNLDPIVAEARALLARLDN
jgi:hypothetical protein